MATTNNGNNFSDDEDLTEEDLAEIDRSVATGQSNQAKCSGCGKEGNKNNLRGCSACKYVRYCNERCQRSHWSAHRVECKRITKLQNPIAARCPFAGNPEELFKLKVLSKEERAEKMRDCWMSEEEVMCDMEPMQYTNVSDYTKKQAYYLWEGYSTIEDALQGGMKAILDDGTEENVDSIEELEKEMYGWEYKEYSSLEDAIMDEFDAKSVEEAIWDNAGVERISVIWEDYWRGWWGWPRLV